MGLSRPIRSRRLRGPVEAAAAHSYTRNSLGFVDDLRQVLDDTGRRDTATAVMLVYLMFMLTGHTALDDLRTGATPGIEPERFAAITRRMLATSLS